MYVIILLIFGPESYSEKHVQGCIGYILSSFYTRFLYLSIYSGIAHQQLDKLMIVVGLIY